MQTKSYISPAHRGAFLWISLLLLVLAFQTSHAAGPNRELLSSSPIPAASNSFWNTDMRLCDVDENGNCHASNYAKSIASYGIPGAAAAFLALLSFLIFLPVRCMCNGFGGKNTSEGICPSSSDKREYTRNEILTVKVAAAIVVIPIIIGVAIGFKANSDISSSADTITNSLVKSGDFILQSLETTREALLTLPYTTAYQGTLNNAVATATTVSRNMHDAHDIVDQYDRVRESLMIVGFVFSLVLMFAAIASAIFNIRFIALLIGVLGFLALTVVWLSFGIHLVAGKFTYDVCIDVDILVSNDTTNSNATSIFKSGALANLWKCDNNTDYASLRVIVDNAIATAATQACNARAQVCFNATAGTGFPNFMCQYTPGCGRDTLGVVTDGAHMVVLDNGVNRTVAECAVSCTDATNRNISQTIDNSLKLFTNYTDLYENTILPLISCQFAVDVLLEVREPLCETLFDAFYGVAVSNLIMGIFYVAFIILMIVGFKRFQSLDGGIV